MLRSTPKVTCTHPEAEDVLSSSEESGLLLSGLIESGKEMVRSDGCTWPQSLLQADTHLAAVVKDCQDL